MRSAAALSTSIKIKGGKEPRCPERAKTEAIARAGRKSQQTQAVDETDSAQKNAEKTNAAKIQRILGKALGRLIEEVPVPINR